MDAKEMREFLLDEIERLGSKEALAGVSGLRVSVVQLSTGDLSLAVELYNGRRNETARNGKRYDHLAGEGERVPGIAARELAHDAVAEILYFVKDWPPVATPDDETVARLLLRDVIRAAWEVPAWPDLWFFQVIQDENEEGVATIWIDASSDEANVEGKDYAVEIPIDWSHRFDELRIRHARRVVQKLFAEIEAARGK